MSTFSQLKTRVGLKLGLTVNDGSDEDDLLGGYLNDAVIQFLLDTHCRIAVDNSVSLTAGSADYELDSDILAIHKLIDSANVPLEQVDEERIYELRRSASTSSSVMKYAVAGNMLMVYPTPSAGATLNVYFVPRPNPMSEDSHDPSSTTYGGIPSEFHPALEDYAAWQMADYDDDVSSGQGQAYFGSYNARVGRYRTAQTLKGGTVLPKARVGRTPRLPSNPSTDSVWG